MKVERPEQLTGTKSRSWNKVMVKKKQEEEERIGNVDRTGKRARKSSQEGRRDKRRQTGAVTRKADVLNEIKQLSI